MTTDTLTITAFILERIAEDEAVAMAAIPASSANWTPQSYRVIADGEWEVAEASVPSATHIARNDPARVLATCKAHRAIVEAAIVTLDMFRGGTACDLAHTSLRALASIWADHDSYDERWAL